MTKPVWLCELPPEEQAALHMANALGLKIEIATVAGWTPRASEYIGTPLHDKGVYRIKPCTSANSPSKT